MKKIKIIVFSFIMCLTLFSFTVPTFASTSYKGNYYEFCGYDINNTNIGAITSSTWGNHNNLIFFKSTNTSNNPIINLVIYVGLNNSLPVGYYDVDFQFYISGTVASSYQDVKAGFYQGGTGFLNTTYTSTNYSRYEDKISGSATLYNSNPNANYFNIVLPCYITSTSVNLGVAMNDLYIDKNSNAGELNNINSSISNINSNIYAMNNSIVSLSNDFVNLNNDLNNGFDSMVTAVGTVTAGIGALGDTIESGIGTIFGGITTLISNSGSIKDMVRSIADSVASLDLNFMNWWNEYISNYTYVLMALNNINSSIQTYCGQIINDLGIINSSMYTCTNAVTSTMNAMNRDIQEQMIAQGNGINSSIKTMETAIVTKLNDTLVVNDKTGIQNNDTVTEDLDSAINDYDSVEQGLVTDFNESLDSLDTDSASNIYNQNDFIRTTTFISTNMQNIYESNDFIGGFIDLTLLLGLIFIVIGIGVR